MSFDPSVTPTVIAASEDIGAGEVTVNQRKDGAVAAASIPVPSGQTLCITDWVVTAGPDNVQYRIQKTTDGIAWSDVAVMRCPGGETVKYSPKAPAPIVGGALVAIRLRAESDVASGTTSVQSTITGKFMTK